MNKDAYPIKVHLDTPVIFGDEEIKVIGLKKPKARDIRGLKGDPGVSDLLDLAIKIGDQPKPVIDDLEVPDAMKLLEVVGGFFPSGLETGPKS